MEELTQITVTVNSRDPKRKNYDSLLNYAISEANKLTKSMFNKYRFINVIPTTTTNHTSMTDFCELVVFLSVSA